jgi:raffinose/stachyose/melibiose transport system substrate-binding protein
VSRRVAVLAVAVALVLGGSTAALAGGSTSAQAPSGTLTILWPDSLQLGLNAQILNFQAKYPRVHIQFTVLPYVQYQSTILTELQAGSSPDLFFVGPGGGQALSAGALGGAHRLLDLSGSPWLKQIPRADQKEFIDANGRPVAYVMANITFGVFYNKQIFRTHGLSVPKTQAQLLALCPKLTAAGITPIGMTITPQNTGAYQSAASYITTLHDPTWLQQRLSHKTTVAANPGWHRIFQWVADLTSAGCFSPGVSGISVPSAQASFAQGQAAMYIGSSNGIPTLNTIVPGFTSKVDYFPMPADSAKDTRAQIVPGVVMAAAATTKVPKLAKLFLNFISTSKQSAVFNVANGTFSFADIAAHKAPLTAPALGTWLKSGRYGFAPSLLWPVLAGPTMWAQVAGVITGQISVDQALANQDASFG